MTRVSLLHMIVGFLLIFYGSCFGFFQASALNDYYQIHQKVLTTWQFSILKSAHGHINLFGFLHIFLGLSLPYSNISTKLKKIQFWGFSSGSFAMGVLLPLKAILESDALLYMDELIGICLSGFLAALALHIFGLLKKYLQV